MPPWKMKPLRPSIMHSVSDVGASMKLVSKRTDPLASRVSNQGQHSRYCWRARIRGPAGRDHMES